MAMEEQELSLSSVSRLRTALLLVGTAIGYLSLLPEQLALAYSMLMVSICMSVYGCYLWARLKGRHWIGWSSDYWPRRVSWHWHCLKTSARSRLRLRHDQL